MNAAERTRWVTARARELGFDLCGVAPAADFEELERLPEWLARGYAGEMRYLHDPRRQSPGAAMPGARSIIVCALNYNTPHPYSTEANVAPPFRAADPGVKLDATPSASASSAVRSSGPRGWISRYAWGDDYHQVLGAKLEALLAALRAEFAHPFDARAYVDTGPIVERVAAKYAGLGWLGKNTCLINEHLGSWLFLGVILTTLELQPSLHLEQEQSTRKSEFLNHPITKSPDPPIPPPDLCGNCTQCIDACPTGAIVEPYLLDARRCISYLTIELRGPIPEEFHGAMGWHIFGCDICQDVCPFNRRAPTTAAPEFQPRRITQENGKEKIEKGETGANHSFLPVNEVPRAASHSSDSLLAPKLEWLDSLNEEQFRATFKGSAVKRAKYRGLVRNARIAKANTSTRT